MGRKGNIQMTRELPRTIDASLIEIGDKISIVHHLKNGVTMTMQGVVAERTDQGQTREYRTAEGGVLVAWEPRKRPPRVVLLDRPPARQAALYGMDDWLPDRVGL